MPATTPASWWATRSCSTPTARNAIAGISISPPSNDDAVYSRLELWLEKGTLLQVKTKHYSDSGRLLKIAYYHKYDAQLSGPRPAETIIIDAVDPKLVTTMTNADWRAAEIPDAWYQRDYLPRLKLEQ